MRKSTSPFSIDVTMPVVEDDTPDIITKTAELVTGTTDNDDDFPETRAIPGIGGNTVKDKTEEPEQTPTPEQPKGEYNDYTSYARLALSYQQNDKLISEDIEIPKDLTAEGLKAAILESATKRTEAETQEYIQEQERKAQEHLQELGYTQAHFAYVNHLMAGGSPEVIRNHNRYMGIATATLDSEDKQLAVIRAAGEIQKTKKEYVEAFIAGLSTPEAIEAAAAEAQEEIKAAATALAQQDAERVNALKEAEEQRQNQWNTELSRSVTGGFMGMKVPKSEQAALLEYVTKPTVTKNIRTDNGGMVRETMTGFDAELDDILNNPAKTVALAHYLRNGGFTALVNAAHKASTDKFLEGMDGNTISRQPAREEQPSAPISGGRSRPMTIEF